MLPLSYTRFSPFSLASFLLYIPYATCRCFQQPNGDLACGRVGRHSYPLPTSIAYSNHVYKPLKDFRGRASARAPTSLGVFPFPL
ncbi:hypothetical protein BC827DRAFT_1189601 [Russula dissimulans]|nr:hypothetical protein BC827DRAFT_1189601 [Russula dissimulans]